MEDVFLCPKAKAPVILSYEDLIVVGLPVIQTESCLIPVINMLPLTTIISN